MIKKITLTLFFIIPVLSYAQQERQSLFAKITKSIQSMIHGQSVEIHQDLNNNSIAQQANLNTQSFNSNTSPHPIETTNIETENQINTEQTNKEATLEAINPESEKQNYPFFYQIERDGKKSYILGVNHYGVSFEELPYHEDIKEYLKSADLFLQEFTPEDHKKYDAYLDIENTIQENIQMAFQENDILMNDIEQKITNIFKKIIRDRVTAGFIDYFSTLSKQEQDFLLSLYQTHPFKEYISDLSLLQPYQLIQFIVTSASSVDSSLKDFDDSIKLDSEISDYFIQHKGVTYRRSLDEINNLRLNYTAIRYTATMNEVKDWIRNYDERFSDTRLRELEDYVMSIDRKYLEMYISGEINLEDYEKEVKSKEKGFLEAEIQDRERTSIFLNDFRNPLWLLKIIEAFEQHNSIFITMGFSHLIRQERTPLNIPELEEYTRQNKNLPTNILDMLKNEGFKITRFGEGDFVPASSCQTAFL